MESQTVLFLLLNLLLYCLTLLCMINLSHIRDIVLVAVTFEVSIKHCLILITVRLTSSSKNGSKLEELIAQGNRYHCDP